MFIPRFLREASQSQQLAGTAADRAYQIVVGWADRESQGRLAGDRETSIDTQYLDQIFSEGLGYQLRTRSPDDYHLEHKFTVPGVGTADAALGSSPVRAHPRP